MSDLTNLSSTSVQIRRIYAATRTDVFRAWTDRQRFLSWFGPSEQTEVIVHEFDVRSGGAYRLDMRMPDGEIYKLKGVYEEVREPERLVFTWAWLEGELQTSDSLVTIEFIERGSNTEMLLTHDRLSGIPSRDAHGEGWTACLIRLDKLFATSEH